MNSLSDGWLDKRSGPTSLSSHWAASYRLQAAEDVLTESMYIDWDGNAGKEKKRITVFLENKTEKETPYPNQTLIIMNKKNR